MLYTYTVTDLREAVARWPVTLEHESLGAEEAGSALIGLPVSLIGGAPVSILDPTSLMMLDVLLSQWIRDFVGSLCLRPMVYAFPNGSLKVKRQSDSEEVNVWWLEHSFGRAVGEDCTSYNPNNVFPKQWTIGECKNTPLTSPSAASLEFTSSTRLGYTLCSRSDGDVERIVVATKFAMSRTDGSSLTMKSKKYRTMFTNKLEGLSRRAVSTLVRLT